MSQSTTLFYSTTTTNRVKGMLITHGNLVTLIEGFFHLKQVGEQVEKPEPQPNEVALLIVLLFHVFEFFMLISGIKMVLMERFNFKGMLMAVERYRVSYMSVSPLLVAAFTNSKVLRKYNLNSLRLLSFSGTPLGKELAESLGANIK